MKTELTKRIISSLILIPLSFYIIIQGNILFNFFLALCYLISIYEWFAMNKKFFKYFGIIFYHLLSLLSIYYVIMILAVITITRVKIILVTTLICIFTDMVVIFLENFLKDLI